MNIPCLSNRNKRQQQQQNNNRHSFNGDELHAFDLTWRNYLPSISQFCCFDKRIRLNDDDDIIVEPAYYNDHTLYRGEALQNYLDNPRDWEFESVLLNGSSNTPQFVTRNPFGTKSIKSSGKKKSKNKSKKKKGERPVVMETDLEDDITGYDIQDNHIQDAEFLGDDQIANLAYNRHSSQVMDQYGEELYYQHVQGPIIQEMQAPPLHQQGPREFYAERKMPNLDIIHDDDYEERVVSQQQEEPSSSTYSTQKPQASIEAAQALLSERLDDLTEKLAFIKNNIIHIQPPASSTTPTTTSRKDEDEDDDECDTTTLRTIKRYNEEEQEESIANKNSNRSSTSSGLDSITSEALDVYENTQQQEQASSTRRYSSTSDELHLPSLVDNTPFVSDQHPFTYFTEQQHSANQEEDSEEENNTLNVRNVLDLGRKWFFSASSSNATTTN